MTHLPSAPAQADAREIAAAAAAALATHPARVQRIALGGQAFWVKSEERLSLRLRLQKGSASAGFTAERAALGRLGPAGLPVPTVVGEGEGFFVTPDMGRTLTALWRDPGETTASRLPAFEAGARALAAFHARGLSHGRPAIKDICWDGRRATFLDLERYDERRNRHAGHVQDLVMMLFSAFAETGRPCPETEALAEAYRAVDPAGVWSGAERLCRRLRWLGPLSWPVRRVRRAREFHAIPLTLAAFGAA